MSLKVPDPELVRLLNAAASVMLHFYEPAKSGDGVWTNPDAQMLYGKLTRAAAAYEGK